jgi:hypothetical protein
VKTSLAILSALVLHLTALGQEAPLLKVSVPARQVLLSWPTNSGSFALYTSGSLSAPGVWKAVTNPPVASNGSFIVTDALSASVAFYRLQSLPVANNDTYRMAEGTTLTVPAPGVLANDTGGIGSLTATLVSGPTNGTLALEADGSFSYTPGAGFTATDGFTYQASDGQNASRVATVAITVTPLLFSDDFSRTNLSPWTSEMGTWTLADGALDGTSPLGSYGYAYYDTNGWTNFTVQASIRFSITNGPWGGGIGGRLNATNGAHYAAWVYPEGSGGGSSVLKLIKYLDWTNWSFTPMAQANLPAVGTNWHTVALTFQDASITVSYDGIQELSITDTNYDAVAPYPNGGITADLWTDKLAYTMSVAKVVVSLP